jgi:hypothetical protein
VGRPLGHASTAGSTVASPPRLVAIADDIRRAGGAQVWIDPTVLAVRNGFELAVGSEKPDASCVVYVWACCRRERGWNVYMGLARAVLLREEVPHDERDALALALLLALPGRDRSVAQTKQQHCPLQVIDQAAEMLATEAWGVA